ncbi:MAG: ATP-binding protein [Acidaminococcaceae bacterium]|nr:ATP-binding protein [Acidaminococcaceae bacterium]
MKNPFSLTFGKQPQSLIGRDRQIDEIVDSFSAPLPDYQVCMLTGVRGVGKTVFLTSVANELRQNKDWLVLDLSPERNLLDSMVAELADNSNFLDYLKRAKVSISVFGLGVNFGENGVTKDSAVVLDKMLAQLSKGKKRILVTVDEVVSNKYVREFVSQVQIYLRKNYNIFLLMTGLYENVYDLQNASTMTFLYRAPKLELGPLNLLLVAEKYKEIFDLSDTDAKAMADLTKGYPYAFQVLGYLCFKQKKHFDELLTEYDAYLREYVYDKIWSEMSRGDKAVLLAMAKAQGTKVVSVREELTMPSNNFAIYRKRLLKKGVVAVPEYGHLEFVLPRFKEFVLSEQ